MISENLTQDNLLPGGFTKAKLPPVLEKSQRYNNLPRIKKPGVNTRWTPERLEELDRCRRDVIYFASKYVKIVHVDHGLIDFDMWDYQKALMLNIHENRHSISLCSRQIGKSIITVAYLLHFILFNEFKTVGVIANKGDTARKLLGKLKLAYTYLPGWLQQGVVEWNKGSIEIENGSKILASSTTGDAARGDSLSLLFIDECAFIDTNLWDDFYKSVYPTLSSGQETKIVLVSTANGMNHYYKMWTDAVKGKSSYSPFEVRWDTRPDRDEKWKETQIDNTSKDQFAQEHENFFAGGSDTLISPAILNQIPIGDTLTEHNGLKIYNQPEPGHQYVLTADCSEGINQDSSAFSVIDITTYPFKQVATFKNKTISYLLYPNIIYRVGMAYNSAYVLVENNPGGFGTSVLDILNFELEYENILSPKTEKKKTVDYRLGMRTTKTTKSLGCSSLKDMVELNKLLIQDFDTIVEASGFVKTSKSYEADAGFSDDLIMGLVNFSWFTSSAMFKDLTNKDLRMDLFRNSMKNIDETMLPDLVISDGTNMDDAESSGLGIDIEPVPLPRGF